VLISDNLVFKLHEQVAAQLNDTLISFGFLFNACEFSDCGEYCSIYRNEVPLLSLNNAEHVSQFKAFVLQTMHKVGGRRYYRGEMISATLGTQSKYELKDGKITEKAAH
jgi:hypothetical protein